LGEGYQKNNVPPTPKGVGLCMALVFWMLKIQPHPKQAVA